MYAARTILVNPAVNFHPAFDRLWVYPPDGDRGPFVYYQGLVNGWSEYGGKLYEGNPQAWQTLQAIMDQGAGSAPESGSTISYLLAGLAGLVIGGAAMWLYK